MQCFRVNPATAGRLYDLGRGTRLRSAPGRETSEGQIPFVTGRVEPPMTRLTGYLLRLFSRDALAFFGVAAVIVFLAQCLRVMDTGAMRGSDLGQLFGLVILGLPVQLQLLYFLIIAIALARTLRGLQATRELHIIHVSRRLDVLWRALWIYIIANSLIVLGSTNLLVPLVQQENSQIKARITADLVGRSLVPNRFAEIAPGVTITVGGRGAGGEIRTFFADDTRNPEIRRSYLADSALLTADARGYVLQLRNGSMQFRNADGQFSEISFDRYDMALDSLINTSPREARLSEFTTPQLVSTALSTGKWDDKLIAELVNRMIEPLRLLALCLLVAVMASEPSGRRQAGRLPLEVTTLLIAFVERAVSSYAGKAIWSPATGSLVLLAIVLLVSLWRMRHIGFWLRRRLAR